MGTVVIMAYTLNDIKLAAYNRKELPNMLPNEAALWQGLAYCYDWHRCYPEDQAEECKMLADDYIDFYWNKQRLEER